ncbi:hypothetical protein PRK78_006545 [Emydomyces testavorans]|uniref:Uncharacterized protein n=1 Tax=Emydomyces testavorans TaxID=2070801 RepID=A0AAF0DPC3_9EURO|nr:hypothetical protein PRK78_006545 [Emydomyces testavorans]
MESVKNAYQAAGKVIWGEQKPQSSGEEPISGVKGEGTPSDPYDAGNVTGSEPIAGVKGTGTASDPYDAGNVSPADPVHQSGTHTSSFTGGGSSTQGAGGHATALPAAGTSSLGDDTSGLPESSRTTSSGIQPYGPPRLISGQPIHQPSSSPGDSAKHVDSVTSGLANSSLDESDHFKAASSDSPSTGLTEPAGSTHPKLTSTGGSSIEPASKLEDSDPHPRTTGSELIEGYHDQSRTGNILEKGSDKQGVHDGSGTKNLMESGASVPSSDDQHPVRSTGPELTEAYHNQSRTQNVLEKESDKPDVHDGSGTKHLSEPGSNVPSSDHHPVQSAGQSATSASADATHEQTKPNDAKEPEAAQLPGEEKIVRSTGFAAEGGNFDAAEPGAGREADRLREEQRKKDPNALPAKSSTSRKEKPAEHHGGLWTGSHKAGITLSKAKEKLHIGKHHDASHEDDKPANK